MGRKNKNARQVPRGKRIYADRYIKNKNGDIYSDRHGKYMTRKAADKRRTLEMKKAKEERREISRHLEIPYGEPYDADSRSVSGTADASNAAGTAGAANVSGAGTPKHPHAFEIWFAYLGNHYGTSVQSGCRPVLIVSNDTANRLSHTVTVLPMTSKLKKLDLPTHVLVDGSCCDDSGTEPMLDSVILAEQIVTIDKSVLKNRLCQLTSVTKRWEVIKAIAVQLGMATEDYDVITDNNFTEGVKHNGC